MLEPIINQANRPTDKQVVSVRLVSSPARSNRQHFFCFVLSCLGPARRGICSDKTRVASKLLQQESKRPLTELHDKRWL